MNNHNNGPTEIETAMDLAYHIENPGVIIGQGCATRAFYIDLATKMLPDFENPFARELVESKIRQYS